MGEVSSSEIGNLRKQMVHLYRSTRPMEYLCQAFRSCGRHYFTPPKASNRRRNIPQLSAGTKGYEEESVSPITTTYEILSDDLDNDIGIKLNHDWATKNHLPSATRSLLPRASLISDLYRLLDCPPPPPPTPGFSTPPFPYHPAPGSPTPHTQYHTASSVRVAGSSIFWDPTTSRRSVSALRSHISHTRNITSLLCTGLPESISKLPRGNISIFRGGKSLYLPPQPHLTRGVSLHPRLRQGTDRRVTPRIPTKSTEISRPENQASHHPPPPPLLTRIVRGKPVYP